MVEFLHPQSKDVAKWFLMSSIEWLHVTKEKITMVVTRGKLPFLRFFCYAFHAESEAQASDIDDSSTSGFVNSRTLMRGRVRTSSVSSRGR